MRAPLSEPPCAGSRTTTLRLSGGVGDCAGALVALSAASAAASNRMATGCWSGGFTVVLSTIHGVA